MTNSLKVKVNQCGFSLRNEQKAPNSFVLEQGLELFQIKGRPRSRWNRQSKVWVLDF